MSASEKPPAEFVRRVLSPRQLRLHNPRFGAHGELRAAAYLRRKGYDVLMRNVRVGRGEIDIVALDHVLNELVFVEVKARTSENHGRAEQSVGWKKVRALRASALILLRSTMLQAHRSKNYRFDIIAVQPGTIHHYQNITW